MVTLPPDGAPGAAPLQIEIVVPARNEARRLPGGLDALCRKAADLPVPAGILVVDSASTDATGDVVRQWPAGPVPVRLLRCDRPGKGLAVRTGLLATRAPFVGFCDADMATDLAALDDHRIAVTPLKIDITDAPSMTRLVALFEKGI